MARLSRLDSRPNFDSSDRLSVPQRVSLPNAMNFVACGEMEGNSFYLQSSNDLRNLLDDFSQTAFEKTFLKLDAKDQREICQVILNMLSELISEKPLRKGIIQKIKNFFGRS